MTNMNDFHDAHKRGKRRMPSAEAIHRYWTCDRPGDADSLFNQIDPGEPSCYRCGMWPGGTAGKEMWSRFERCHVVDRCRGGLDGAQNLVLLCRRCHKKMPTFGSGQEALALAWLSNSDAASMELSALAADMLTLATAQGLPLDDHGLPWDVMVGLAAAVIRMTMGGDRELLAPEPEPTPEEHIQFLEAELSALEEDRFLRRALSTEEFDKLHAVLVARWEAAKAAHVWPATTVAGSGE